MIPIQTQSESVETPLMMLDTIPTEVLWVIADHLDVRSIARLGAVRGVQAYNGD